MSTAPIRGASRVLVDTSAYFALVDPGDTNHASARAIAEQLTSERYRQFTTNFILAETHALLLARLGGAVAAREIQEIDRSATIVVRVSPKDEHRGREIIMQYDDKDFSLTDAVSFAVMERLGISQAFTFDKHFAQDGFSILTPKAIR